jgi:hypothetical protein
MSEVSKDSKYEKIFKKLLDCRDKQLRLKIELSNLKTDQEFLDIDSEFLDSSLHSTISREEFMEMPTLQLKEAIHRAGLSEKAKSIEDKSELVNLLIEERKKSKGGKRRSTASRKRKNVGKRRRFSKRRRSSLRSCLSL